jgi:hypothetical protein
MKTPAELFKVYVAGPINGCSDVECKDWRAEVARHHPCIIDPMVRDYRGREESAYREIVELDKDDILKADAVLVRYLKPSVGTSMEILFAYDNCIPVVVWTDVGISISPWMRYHSKFIETTLNDSLLAMRSLVGGRASDLTV